MSKWYIIKGVGGEPALATVSDIKSNTDILHEFEEEGFLNAHRYVQTYRRKREYERLPDKK